MSTFRVCAERQFADEHHAVGHFLTGDQAVLSMAGATELNAKMRALGFTVHEPDMSMFTLGGGGVQSLAQALCRDAG